jgi:hypothetical protein
VRFVHNIHIQKEISANVVYSVTAVVCLTCLQSTVNSSRGKEILWKYHEIYFLGFCLNVNKIIVVLISRLFASRF